MTGTGVAFYCTDNGQHPWTLLGDLSCPPRGLLRANMAFAYGEHMSLRVAECVWLDDIRRPDYRANVRCNRCGRHKEWRGERARELLRDLAAAGVSRVDLSSLH